MKKTENTKTTVTENTTNELKIIGKPFIFVINNDEQTEKTEKASIAFLEWVKTSQNSKKYIDNFGIIPGGWCIDLSDVISFNHVATARDALSGGVVDVIYLIFTNTLLNRFVYIDHTILERGTILLPIDGKIEYVPFGFKYTTARKRITKKQSTTTKTENKTPKTNTKTNSTKTNTTATTEKTPTKKTKTATKTNTTKKAVSENK